MIYEDEDEEIENYEEIEDYDSEDLEEENLKSSTILDSLKTNKKNMYFDEEKVSDLLTNHYLPYLKYEPNKKGKMVCVDRTAVPAGVEKEIMANLLLIANAIINKYRYWRFDTIEDLQAESMDAMWTYLPNFNPSKGTAFDLFSIICKKHLLNFTLKGYKHRIAEDVDAHFEVATPEHTNYNLFLEDIEKTFLDIINNNFSGDKKQKYIELTSILIEYLMKNHTVAGRNDLLNAFKNYGYKSTDYKQFIKEISEYKKDFYNLI